MDQVVYFVFSGQPEAFCHESCWNWPSVGPKGSAKADFAQQAAYYHQLWQSDCFHDADPIRDLVDIEVADDCTGIRPDCSHQVQLTRLGCGTQNHDHVSQ